MRIPATLVQVVMFGGLMVLAPMAEARPGRTGGGGFSRQGTVNTARGAGQWGGTGTVQRSPGTVQSNYQGTRTGANGQTSTVERTNLLNRTGKNSWSRDTQQSVTGPNGQTRSWQAQGNGSVQKTENGHQKTYEGTITNNKGNTTDVNRTTDVTKNADGSVTRQTEATYTNEQTGKTHEVDRTSTTTKNEGGGTTTTRSSTLQDGNGNVMGTGQSTTVHTPGEGYESNGSYTNSQGKTWQYEGESHRTEPGTWEHSQTTTNPEGKTRSSTATAKWQYVDGKWVKVTEGTVTPGTTPSPSPSP